ncbi:uncharacterized protein [Chelonus insularis]|uniref:uncharacterized protein n=1 Tax=Chelonus insularis TaxID=460826 RepID=UPI00158B1964|nr:uncharacterized protein LOC118064576 [Chelonus insularis]
MKKSLSIIFIFTCILRIESRPQMMMDPDYDLMDDIFVADGFSFDGPADRSNPNFMNNRPPLTVTDQPIVNVNNPTTGTVSTTMSPVLTNCIQSCLATSEFNPVCGTDGVDYNNPGRLTCAQRCGKDVRLRYFGRCSTTNPRG